MHAADDRAVLEPVTDDRGGQLIETCAQLEIDVQPHVGCLIDEECERVVDSRHLGRDITELGERQLANRPLAAPWLTSSR